MQKLIELRNRVEAGESELSVVLVELADRLQFLPRQKERFDTLVAVGAFLDATMMLAVHDLDIGAIDIEVAYRSDPAAGSYGRSEICGPQDDVRAHGGTPEEALCAAYLKAKIDRMKNPVS